ncbi:MAG: redoxin domain-containing protein [Bacteroidales bacterium]|nr:redoxin domain-containing protein [Bacteroidales bacterium]
MVKENDFKSKIGTQVGMIAPDFNCKTIDGDSLTLNQYTGKYVLLINVTACWSKVSSYECFRDLTASYKGKFDIIGLDNSPVTLKNNIKSLNLQGKFIIVDENKMLKKYRPMYCSRTCFLINPEGRIVDKFEIFDWKSNLGNIFGDINNRN